MASKQFFSLLQDTFLYFYRENRPDFIAGLGIEIQNKCSQSLLASKRFAVGTFSRYSHTLCSPMNQSFVFDDGEPVAGHFDRARVRSAPGLLDGTGGPSRAFHCVEAEIKDKRATILLPHIAARAG